MMISSRRDIEPTPNPLRRGTIALIVLGGLAMLSGSLSDLPFVSIVGSWLWLIGMTLTFFYDALRGRSQSDDRAIIARQLAAMLRLGIPLDEALARLGQVSFVHTGSRSFQALPTLARAVASGSQLDEAVEATEAFPPIWAALLSGVRRHEDLPAALEHLSRLESRRFALPGVVLARVFLQLPFTIGIFSFLTVYIFPTFVQLAEGMELPVPGVFVATLWIGRHGSWLLLLVGLTVIAQAIAPVRALLWRWVARLPGLWTLTRIDEQARFCEVAAAACELGLPTPEVLELTRIAATQPAYRRAAQGPSLSELMRSHPRLFDPRVAWMVEQGERGEDLPGALRACRELLHVRFRLEQRRLGHWIDLWTLLALGTAALVASSGLFSVFNLIHGSVGPQ